MKKTTLTLSVLLLSAGLILNSCGGKKKWPDAEQKAFMDSCVPGAAENPSIDANKYCSCMLEKIMDKYPTPADAEKMSMADMMADAEKCLK